MKSGFFIVTHLLLLACVAACSRANQAGLNAGSADDAGVQVATERPAADAAPGGSPEDPACPEPLSACGIEEATGASVCVDLAVDEANCGACGRRCPVGRTCQGGSCDCAVGQIECDGACVNPESESMH